VEEIWRRAASLFRLVSDHTRAINPWHRRYRHIGDFHGVAGHDNRHPGRCVETQRAGSPFVQREKGRLDVVFANAGVAKYAALGTIAEEFYDSIFDINVKGVLFTVQKALPLLTNGASIILNSSIVGGKGLSMNSIYRRSSRRY
jgi:Enoyl-(Acyl carrier protein) reductase